MGNDTEMSEKRGVPGYVVTPIGDIQKYTPSGRAFGIDGDLGTLQWIYYSWWLSHRNGKKWWYQKNDIEKTRNLVIQRSVLMWDYLKKFY